MRFKKTSGAKKLENIMKWHRWFAWKPVRIDEQIVWLETIERRMWDEKGDWHVPDYFMYREIQRDRWGLVKMRPEDCPPMPKCSPCRKEPPAVPAEYSYEEKNTYTQKIRGERVESRPRPILPPKMRRALKKQDIA